MKKLIYTLIAIIVGIIVVNVFKLDSGDVFEGDSSIAVVSILAALMCVCIAMDIVGFKRNCC